jgi:hypothetical protein
MEREKIEEYMIASYDSTQTVISWWLKENAGWMFR